MNKTHKVSALVEPTVHGGHGQLGEHILVELN